MYERNKMMLDGHWIVRFASVAGEKVQRESGGVVTLHNGQIVGGDTWSYYSGTYQLAGRRLTLRLDVSIHFTNGGESILGGPLVPYTLIGVGEVSQDIRRIDTNVHVEGNEAAVIVAILSKVVDFQSQPAN
jgi:hypothetical protein